MLSNSNVLRFRTLKYEFIFVGPQFSIYTAHQILSNYSYDSLLLIYLKILLFTSIKAMQLLSKQEKSFQLDLFLKCVIVLLKYKYSKGGKQLVSYIFTQLWNISDFFSCRTTISDKSFVGTDFNYSQNLFKIHLLGEDAALTSCY